MGNRTSKETLGDRMKRYEEVTNFRLMPRSTAILRMDGVAFHTLTKRLKLEKPYDRNFSGWMAAAAVSLAKYAQGIMLGYTQSDELTFVIRADQSEDSSPWFDYRIQKIASVSSGIVSSVFNRLLYLHCLSKGSAESPIASFDSRLHQVPGLTEAVNNLIWRQRDCTKNAISGAAYYEIGKLRGKKTARAMLEGLHQDQRQDLLFTETGLNWNDYAPEFKRGIVIFKREVEVETEHGKALRRKWTAEAAPIFTSEEGRAWLCEVLGYTRSVKKNVQEEGIRQDQSD